MNPLLDTVEPVAWAREWEGDDSDIGQYCVVFHEDEKDINPNWFEVYSCETVESLLSQCRKEALLEAAEYFNGIPRNAWYGHDIAHQLRRMAESDKTTMEGEK